MEARSFFERSSMAEVAVSAAPHEWQNLLIAIWNEAENLDDPNFGPLVGALKSVGITW